MVRRPKHSSRRERGFTLLELMAVMFIMSVLAGIAMPQFRVSVIRAREVVLLVDLFQFRDLIDQYYADKGRYPPSLEALVEDGYLRRIPKDPLTGTADWQVVYEEPSADDFTLEIGIYDVHSSAPGTSLSGTPYAEW